MEVLDADFDIKLAEGVVEGVVEDHLAMHFERWVEVVEVVAEGQTTFDFEGK
jgi:hypothetical protein